MGLGNTAKKVQALAELAETLAEQFKALRQRVIKLESTADETNERVEALEAQLTYQQDLIEAIAAEHDIDPTRYAPEEAAEDEQTTT